MIEWDGPGREPHLPGDVEIHPIPNLHLGQNAVERGDAVVDKLPWSRRISAAAVGALTLLCSGSGLAQGTGKEGCYFGECPPVGSNRPGALEPFQECPVCPEMVALPGGVFTMGSSGDGHSAIYGLEWLEGPQRQVAIAPFAIGKTEVTFAEWDACVDAGGCNGYRPDDEGTGRGPQPVINVSWHDAQAYVNWLSRLTRNPYRLPSEAEWEYAARAGTKTPFSFGMTISTAQANFGPDWSASRPNTVPTGSLPANSWGLHEMHGNVAEWVEDCWHDNYLGAPTSGRAWIEWYCHERVDRGGSWADLSLSLRSASRRNSKMEKRMWYLGFRVARTLTP